MPLEPLVPVRATHDIQRFRTVVVKQGANGIILDVKFDSWGMSYTVEFQPAGLAGAKIMIQQLSANDVQTVG